MNFTKQQRSINNAQLSLNAKKAIINNFFGIGGSVITGAAAIGTAARTGGMSIGIGLGLAGASGKSEAKRS